VRCCFYNTSQLATLFSRSSESNDEDVCVSTTSRVVFERDVEDVSHALWLQFFNRFLPLTVNKWDTLDNTFAGVQCPMRAGCDITASQIVQLIDCSHSTLGGSSDLDDKVS